MWLTCFGKGKWKRLGTECKERKKNLDEIVLEALVFRYSRPELPYFANHWYNVLREWPVVLLRLWEVVASWGRGITPKLLSLFCFRERKEIIFSFITFFPVSFVLEKKNHPVHFVLFPSSQFSSTLRLLPPNSKHPQPPFQLRFSGFCCHGGFL